MTNFDMLIFAATEDPVIPNVRRTTNRRLTIILLAALVSAMVSLGGCDPSPSLPLANTYTVTYYANGADSGTVPANSNTYFAGATVTVSGNTGGLVKASHIFSGWNTAADGSGTTYTADSTFVIMSADLILYALWTMVVQNNAPSDILLSSAEIQERVAVGTVVGTFAAIDVDDDTHVFSIALESGDPDAFSIENDQLVTAAEIDYESKSSYEISIIADDGVDVYQKGFTIAVLDYHDYLATDYITTASGHGVKYHVTDEHGPMAADIWVVAQAVPGSAQGQYEYISTLVKNGAGGDYFRNSTIAGRIKEIGGRNSYVFHSGIRVGNQANFYRNVVVPLSMEIGDIITDEDWGSYTISGAGTVTIGTVDFDNCIRIDIDRLIEGEEYTSGSGYAILAPGIGIVSIEFTRGDEVDPIALAAGDDYSNTLITYTYIEHADLSPYSISGIVTTDSTTPAPDVYVQIAGVILDTFAVSDASGEYTLTGVYGPDVHLYLGYDGNDAYDGIFDFDYPVDGYPRELDLNGITGDVSAYDIDLSSLE